jgi:cytidine deaminase
MGNSIDDKAINKAKQSTCRYKVSAIGLNKKGDVFCSSINKQFLSSRGGGLHAEMILMRRYGRKIKSIIICRINNYGEPLPIDPCENCKKMADKLDITITSVKRRNKSHGE